MQYESERCYNLPIVNFCFVYYMILVSFDQYAHYVVLSKLAKKCRNSAKNTDSMITKLCYIFFFFFLKLVSPRYLIFILSSQVIFSDYLILSFQFLGVKYLILSFWTKKKDRKHCFIEPVGLREKCNNDRCLRF
jgi:hypothetical protein